MRKITLSLFNQISLIEKGHALNDSRIQDLIEKDGKLQAIKIVMTETGMTLREAKEYVDRLAPAGFQRMDFPVSMPISIVESSKSSEKQEIEVPLTSHRNGITVLVKAKRLSSA